MEHSDPNSYSWKLMRFACMKLCKQKITQMLSVAGIEHQGKSASDTAMGVVTGP